MHIQTDRKTRWLLLRRIVHRLMLSMCYRPMSLPADSAMSVQCWVIWRTSERSALAQRRQLRHQLDHAWSGDMLEPPR
eukprot:7804942-Pyramimonas_sp.AAC.1